MVPLARTRTPTQLPAELFKVKANGADVVVPADFFACWTKTIGTSPKSTVKFVPLLATPPAVTTTFPCVAPAGTGTRMDVGFQLVGVAATPLNVTVPCDVPKLRPEMVNGVPTKPEVADRLAIVGVEMPPNLATKRSLVPCSVD